jgi:cytochrome c5
MAGEKMKLQALIAIGILECCCLLSYAQGTAASHATASEVKALKAKAAVGNPPQPSELGELKFQQNCSRCHNSPQELSRRISGTVMMHMRARASLGAADERAILHYLAP